MHRFAIPLTVAALVGLSASSAGAQQPSHFHDVLRSASPSGAPTADSTLRVLAAQAVQALLANDASHLPLTDDFRYTENGSPLAIGDGIWGTLTAYAGQDPLVAPAAATLQFRYDLVDAETGEILAWRAIDEHGTPGMLVLRLKARDGRIAEMEAIAIREEAWGPRGGTLTLLQPRLLQMLDADGLGVIDPSFLRSAPAQRDSLIAAANAFLDGEIAAKIGRIPLGDDCVRRDNGHLTTGNMRAAPLDPAVPGYKPWALGCAAQIDSGLYRYIERVRDRRFFVDSDRGVVAVIDLADVPGTLHEIRVPGLGTVAYPGPVAHRKIDVSAQFDDLNAPNLRVPSSILSIHLLKIEDGKIVRFENFHRGQYLGFRSGW